MRIHWIISKSDASKVRAFYDSNKRSHFVRARREKNIHHRNLQLTKSAHWRALVLCLLTTQQKSGPNSRVHKFLHSKPFPLRLNDCLCASNAKTFSHRTLKQFGGIRRSQTIASELAHNLLKLGSEWNIKEINNALLKNNDYQLEREYCHHLASLLKGIGPKQSRNYLQSLGLIKYETPIDSRITKWLNEFGFPIKLTATALSDHEYYNMVSDGFRELCLKAGVYPCLMDAAIFASYDQKSAWTRNNSDLP
jgi:N-glycosylase/DNA lyase